MSKPRHPKRRPAHGRPVCLLGALVVLALASMPVLAHKQSDAYLTLRTDAGNPQLLHGQWDIALRDLDFAIGIDSDRDGALTWGEVKAHRRVIERYALNRLRIAGDGLTCSLRPRSQMIDTHTDGSYNVLLFTAACDREIPNRLTVGYRLFADVDPYHRGIVTLQAGGRTAGAVLGPGHAVQRFTLGTPDRWRQFVNFVGDGIRHITGGFDHLLFILSLLLPAVLVRRRRDDDSAATAAGEHWLPVATPWPAFIETLKVVTAFTVSHSITLALAVFGIVDLPSRLVESGIALSIIVAALNNIFPVVQQRIWVLAFGFGFIHGLGFASALAGLQLPPTAMLASLGGFNIGVEIGQEAIVLAFLPLALYARGTRFYRHIVLHWGSAAIALIALGWFIERAFGVVLPVFGALLPR